MKLPPDRFQVLPAEEESGFDWASGRNLLKDTQNGKIKFVDYADVEPTYDLNGDLGDLVYLANELDRERVKAINLAGCLLGVIERLPNGPAALASRHDLAALILETGAVSR